MKMKFIIYIMLAVSLLLAATSCQREEAEIRTGGDEVIFTAIIGQQAVQQTRMTNNTWDSGDAIGVYMLNSDDTFEYMNMKYVWNGANFVPASDADKMLYKHDGGTVRFVAYYPYTATIGGSQNPPGITYLSNVENQGDPSKIDLLVGRTGYVSRSKNPVPITFEHKLSKLELTIVKGKGIETLDLTQMEVNLYGVNSIAEVDCLNVYDDAQQWDAFIDYLSANYFEAYTVSAGSAYEFIFVPHEGTIFRRVNFAVGSVTYYWDIPTSLDFEVGKRHPWTITINESGITATPGDILPWEGTTDPPTTGDTKLVYKVGDYYPDPYVMFADDDSGTVIKGVAPQGIVFWLDPSHADYDASAKTGKSGRIVDLIESPTMLAWGEWGTTVQANSYTDGLYNTSSYHSHGGGRGCPPFDWIHFERNNGSASYNTGAKGFWYLPSIGELQFFHCAWNGMEPETWRWPGSDNPGSSYASWNPNSEMVAGDPAAQAEFNTKLTAAGGDKINSGWAFYCSSTEADAGNVWELTPQMSMTSRGQKHDTYNVRAIMAF